MDQKLWQRIKQASIDSIQNPGQNTQELPKEESIHHPEIYVFRHGQTHDNINRVFSGWRNSQLTDQGREQARILQEKLVDKHIDLCIVSPQDRSRETAKIALSQHPAIIFEIDERIMERNYGTLHGKSKEKAMRDEPELTIKYRRGYDFPPPQGESLKMVEERVFPFCEELIDRVKRNNLNVAISCHGNSMRAIRKYFENLTLIEELTVENPLGTDYAAYVIANVKYHYAEPHFSKTQLRNLIVPNTSLFNHGKARK